MGKHTEIRFVATCSSSKNPSHSRRQVAMGSKEHNCQGKIYVHDLGELLAIERGEESVCCDQCGRQIEVDDLHWKPEVRVEEQDGRGHWYPVGWMR